MNFPFSYRKLSHQYPDFLYDVMRSGTERESRIGKTREVMGMSLKLGQPEYCIIDRNGFSTDFMDLEIAMLLGGTFDEDLTRKVLPRAGDLISSSTAYGPRVVTVYGDQLSQCEHELRTDPTSRRAMVYVGREDDLGAIQNPDRKGEMPCTAIWQFLLRDERLNMIVYMRSWDLVWGLSYDIPCFVANQMALAKALDVKVGTYMHAAGSAHIYERHFEIEARVNPDEQGLLDIPWLRDNIADTRLEALDLLNEMRREYV